MGASSSDPTALVIFETEVAEAVAAMQEHVLRIEQGQPDREERLAGLLRHAHNVKGTARVMEAHAVARLAHALEEHLMAWRGQKTVDPSAVDLALNACDLLVPLSIDARAPDVADAGALERRARADALCAELDPSSAAGSAVDTASRSGVAPAVLGAHPGPNGTTIRPAAPAAPATPAPAVSAAPASANPREETLRVMRRRVEASQDDAACGLIQVKQVQERFQELRRAVDGLRGIRLPQGDVTPGSLARLRGEMHAAHRAVIRSVRQADRAFSHLITLVHNIDARATDLSVVPSGPLVGQLERAARDAAALLGRAVRFEFEGGGVHLDKGLVEELKGPLIHAVRNAVDHGLEPRGERTAAGKDPTGVLRLVLREEHESLRIVLSDDGRGIDRDAVRARLGETVTGLDDRALLARLLRSGVSTRDTATEISGRGIGLGALAALADRLRGDVSLTSQPGAGTTVSLRLPRRISLLEALVVESGGMRFVLPMSGLCRVEPADERRAVPSLATVLGLPDAGPVTHVLTMAGRDRRGRFGIAGPGHRDEIVQRPVGAHLQRVTFASGVTVLPGGDPAWILDPRELVDACPEDPEAERVRRILLVDDSPALRAALHNDLMRAGYDVVLADDGRMALDRLEAMSFDAVVSDIQMPRLDGFGLLERCRDRLPVVLVSSLSGPEVVRRARDDGAAAFLVKDSTLGSRVEAVLADVFSRKLESNP